MHSFSPARRPVGGEVVPRARSVGVVRAQHPLAGGQGLLAGGQGLLVQRDRLRDGARLPVRLPDRAERGDRVSEYGHDLREHAAVA